MPPVAVAVNVVVMPGCWGATRFALINNDEIQADGVPLLGGGVGGGAVVAVPAITKSMATEACASSAVAPALRAQTVTRPDGNSTVGVHAKVLEVVQSPTGFQVPS